MKMRICGQVSTTEEAEEIEFITKSFSIALKIDAITIQINFFSSLFTMFIILF
jgi:hypothetical protein